jgi:hypothetical protein
MVVAASRLFRRHCTAAIDAYHVNMMQNMNPRYVFSSSMGDVLKHRILTELLKSNWNMFAASNIFAMNSASPRAPSTAAVVVCTGTPAPTAALTLLFMPVALTVAVVLLPVPTKKFKTSRVAELLV